MKMINKDLDKAYKLAKKSLRNRSPQILDAGDGSGGGGTYTPRPKRRELPRAKNGQLTRVTSAIPSKKTKKPIVKETGEYRQDATARYLKKLMKRREL
jgi:hypothetical protein